jgi:hypothetical protein
MSAELAAPLVAGVFGVFEAGETVMVLILKR